MLANIQVQDSTYTDNKYRTINNILHKKNYHSILKIDHLQRLYLRIHDLECYHDVHI
jgi:hypothetical protein